MLATCVSSYFSIVVLGDDARCGKITSCVWTRAEGCCLRRGPAGLASPVWGRRPADFHDQFAVGDDDSQSRRNET
jgi:hypothetical protein